MYRLTVTVVQVLDGYSLRARLEADDWEGAGWEPLAEASDTLPAPETDLEDAFHSILAALREWSVRTVSE